MKKLLDYFQLHQPYKFDPQDIITAIQCSLVGATILGLNMTPLFLAVSCVSLIYAITLRRVNLVFLQLGFIALNAYYLI